MGSGDNIASYVEHLLGDIKLFALQGDNRKCIKKFNIFICWFHWLFDVSQPSRLMLYKTSVGTFFVFTWAEAKDQKRTATGMIFDRMVNPN